MRLREDKLPKLDIAVLFILSGVLFYWGLNNIISIIATVTLVLTQIFDLHINIYIITAFGLDGVLIAFLLIVLLKVLKSHKQNSLSRISEIEINWSIFLKLGVIVIVTFIIGLVLKLLTLSGFVEDINTYLIDSEENVENLLFNMKVVTTLADVIKMSLLFALFFSIVLKLKENRHKS